MARRRRGRCHRQRQRRHWSFSDFKKVPASAYISWMKFLLKGFPTIFQKDYEKDGINKTEDEVKSNAERFAGYKSICLFGLGSLFWGSATGVLAQLEAKYEKDKGSPTPPACPTPPEWINFCFVYSAFALVFMLLGVTASTFYKSSWLAPSVAGFGSLQALILVLGGFHVASLKYHNYLDECLKSMIWSTILITIYWGLSVQDPLVLHSLVKFLAWLIGRGIYEVVMGACKVWQFVKTKACSGNNTSNGYQTILP